MNLQEERDRVYREANAFGTKYGYPSYDCGTKALAIAANMSYWGAYQKLKGSRTIGHKITQGGPINGFWFKGFRPKACTAAEFAKQYPTGRYIIYCWHYNSRRKDYYGEDGRKSMAHHYAVCIDGELANASSYMPVKYAFRC